MNKKQEKEFVNLVNKIEDCKVKFELENAGQHMKAESVKKFSHGRFFLMTTLSVKLTPLKIY